MVNGESRFREALRIARDFHTPGDEGESPEYTRGQAELICDLFGIPTDQKEAVMAYINHTSDTLVVYVGG